LQEPVLLAADFLLQLPDFNFQISARLIFQRLVQHVAHTSQRVPRILAWPSSRFGRMPHGEIYGALCNVDQFRRNTSSIMVF